MSIGETEPERSTGIDLASCGLAQVEPLGPTMAPFVTGELVGLLDAWDSLTGSWSRADIAATRTAIRRVRGNLSTMRPMLDDTWVDEIRSSLKMFGQGLSQVCQRDAVHDLADEFLDRHRVHSAVHARFEASATDRAAMMAEARELFVGPNGTQTRNALARAVERNIPLRTESDADTWKPCRDVLPGLVLEPWREMRRAARIDEHGSRFERMRKSTRHLRYASELVTPILGSVAEELGQDAGAVQHVLRRHRDAAALLEWTHAASRHDHTLTNAAHAFLADVTAESVGELKPRLSKVINSGRRLNERAKTFRIGAGGGVVWRSSSFEIEVALVHRSRQRDWSLPKGKTDPGESLRECAVREVWEETGLSCKAGDEVMTTSYRDGRGVQKDVTYYSMEVGPCDTFGRPDPREIDALLWTSVGAARSLVTRTRDRQVLEAFQSMVPPR